jgi:hypothetical protein
MTAQLVCKLGLIIFTIKGLSAQASFSPCDVNHNGVINIADVQLIINEALGMPCTADVNGDGKCDIVDVQRVITATIGGTCNATAHLETFTFYVDSANGSDSNPGTQSLPWKTIAKVNSTTLTPGQSVGFKRGGMWRETLTPGQSGTVENPITFAPYGSGAKPVINGADLVTEWSVGGAGTPANVYRTPVSWRPYVVTQDSAQLTNVGSLASINAPGEWWYDSTTQLLHVRATDSANPTTHVIEVGSRDYCVNLNGTTYITVNGFSLFGPNENGVVVQGGANHALINGNTIENIGHRDWGAGIHVRGGTYATISNNEVSNAWVGITVQGWYAPLSNYATITRNNIHDVDTLGANVTNGNVGNPTNTIFEYNTVYNAVQGQDDNAGMGSYHSGTGTIFRYNTISNCGTANFRGSGINVDSWSAPTLVYGNVVYGNNYGGINLTSAGHSVYNNTLWHNNENTADAGEISIFAQEGIAGSSETIKNNVLVASAGKHLIRVYAGNTTGHVLDYNLYYSSQTNAFDWGGVDENWSDWKTATGGQEMHSLNVDPALANPPANLTLQPRSPAIGAGIYIPGVSAANPPNIGAWTAVPGTETGGYVLRAERPTAPWDL